VCKEGLFQLLLASHLYHICSSSGDTSVVLQVNIGDLPVRLSSSVNLLVN